MAATSLRPSAARQRATALRTAAFRRQAPRAAAGFTLLEILISMAIFTVLGTMMVWFMGTSLDIFRDGTQASDLMDRADTVLPRIRRDLNGLTIPDNFEPPRKAPDPALLEGRDLPPPPPPVWIRLRSGFIKLQHTGIDTYKDYPCPYFAFVMADAGEWSDPIKRRAGEQAVQGTDMKGLNPKTVRSGSRDSHYRPTGGLTEICWIAVPQDVMNPEEKLRYPGVLSLYRGFRTPIGDKEKSLLVPENLDSPRKIAEACQLVAEGLVHFGAKWRRAFATGWDDEEGVGLGETGPYVGPIWDSTRALEKTWSLFRSKESLGDPSDDIFPAFVRLEATLAAPSQFGHGRGEMRLLESTGADNVEIRISDPDILYRPDLGKVRWVKVGTEWMRYDISGVNYAKGTVRVYRGMRGTVKHAHEAGTWIYVGLPSALEMRLPVFRDRTVVQKREGP